MIGLSLLVVSKEIVALFNGNDSTNEHFAVYLGTALIGFAIANWMYSRMSDLKSIQPSIYGNLASLVPAAIIDVVTIFEGKGQTIIWLVLALHVVFGAAFAYSLWIINSDLHNPKSAA